MWPVLCVLHLCSVGASHASHLWYYLTQTVTTNNGGATTLPTLQPCRSMSETDDHCPHQRARTRVGGNVCFSHVNLIWIRGLPVQRSQCLLFIVSTTVFGNHLCIFQCSYIIFQFDVLYSPRWLSSSAYGTSSGSCPTFPAALLTIWFSWLPTSFRRSASHSPYSKWVTCPVQVEAFTILHLYIWC